MSDTSDTPLDYEFVHTRTIVQSLVGLTYVYKDVDICAGQRACHHTYHGMLQPGGLSASSTARRLCPQRVYNAYMIRKWSRSPWSHFGSTILPHKRLWNSICFLHTTGDCYRNLGDTSHDSWRRQNRDTHGSFQSTLLLANGLLVYSMYYIFCWLS